MNASRRAALALVLLGGTAAAPADDACGPLFVIARSLNANVVLYEAGTRADGTLDPARPVRVTWRLDARDGRREGLNFIERVRAYGVDVAPLADRDTWKVTVRALPARPLVLRGGPGCPYVTASIEGREAVLKRVFVATTGGLLPKVKSVELSGFDVATWFPVLEIFSPR